MPEEDRLWPVWAAGALIFIALEIVAAVVYVRGPVSPADALAALLVNLNATQVIAAISLVALPVSFAGTSVRLQRRHRLRSRALAGDVNSLPLAEMPDHTPTPASAIATPLELLWQRTPTMRGTQYVVAALLGLLCLCFALLLAGRPLLHLPGQWPDYFVIALSAWSCGLALLVIVFAARLAAARRARKVGVRGVIATDEGIVERRGSRPEVTIPWNEARLLEVVAPQSGAERALVFILHGQSRAVVWRHYLESRKALVPEDGSTFSEMQSRQQAFLDFIAARTGLVPRTLSPSLALDPGTLRGVGGSNSAWNELGLKISLTFTLAVAAWVCWALPLTRYPVVNLYAALSLALAGAANVAVSAVKRIVLLRRANGNLDAARRELPEITRTLPAVLRLNYVIPLRYRLWLFGTGAALTLDAVAFILAIVACPTASQRGHPLPPGTAGFTMAVLALCSLYGLLIAAASFGPRRVSLIADADGLTERRGRSVRKYLWANLFGVVATWDGRRFVSFNVTDRETGYDFGWRPSWVHSPFSHDPAVMMSDELAVVISERTGKPFRVERA